MEETDRQRQRLAVVSCGAGKCWYRCLQQQRQRRKNRQQYSGRRDEHRWCAGHGGATNAGDAMSMVDSPGAGGATTADGGPSAGGATSVGGTMSMGGAPGTGGATGADGATSTGGTLSMDGATDESRMSAVGRN